MNSAEVVLDPAPSATHANAPAIIRATDLIGARAERSAWRRGRSSGDPRSSATVPSGWISPMGYRLAQVGEAGYLHPGANEIHIVAPGDPAADSGPAEKSTPGRLGRPPQTVRLKGPDGELVLTIDGGRARVIASATTWEAMSEPVVLAVCLHWRLQAIDAEIDRLTVHAEGDIPHAAMSVVASLWNRKRLLRHARDVRAVMIDLPHFEGPLTDPLPYLSTERAAPTFRALAEKLHLEEWGEAIDDRAEAVEDIYASVTEKLNEFRNFAVGSTLEILIVVILLAELAFHLFDNMGP
jgi:hypothetical protein